MEIALTRISSRGQIVIPASMRKGIKDGTDFILIKEDDKIVIHPVSSLEKSLREDIEFADRTKKALLRYTEGKFIRQEADEFLSDIESW